jgi:DNA polymerase-3 subunit beta
MVAAKTEDLQEALKAINAFGARENSVAFLEAYVDELVLSAHSIDGGWIERRIAAKVGDKLVAALSLRQLAAIVGVLVGEDVEITVAGKRCTVSSGGSTFRLPVNDVEPLARRCAVTATDAQWASVAGAIDRVSHAVSHDTTRYNICGVHVQREGDSLVAVATDGHRLALARAAYPAAGCELPTEGVIVSLSAVRVLHATGSGEGRWRIAGSALHYADEAQKLVVPLVAGTFPDWRGVVSTQDYSREDEVGVAVSTSALVEVVDQSRAIGATGIAIELDGNAGTLRLAAQNADHGDLDATRQGRMAHGTRSVRMASNPNYLREALRCIGTESVELRFGSDLDPIIALPADSSIGQARALSVVMPMRE